MKFSRSTLVTRIYKEISSLIFHDMIFTFHLSLHNVSTSQFAKFFESKGGFVADIKLILLHISRSRIVGLSPITKE